MREAAVPRPAQPRLVQCPPTHRDPSLYGMFRPIPTASFKEVVDQPSPSLRAGST